MKSILFLIAAAMAATSSAQAQATSTTPRCAGDVQVMRVSKIKPGSSIADFEKTVGQHMAWYRAHG